MDFNKLAKSIVDQATSEEQPESPAEEDQEQNQPIQDADSGKNPAAVALGKLGGKKGGPARAKKLTKERRSEIARKAAQARWSKSEQSNE